MSLNSLKSMLAQSITCELDMLQKGNLECANKMLQYRKAAHMRIYMIECLLSTYPAQNKVLVEYMMEQLKSLIQLMTINEC
jgi:hypothetical protein